MDITTFRLLFPEFADPAAFPDDYLSAQYDTSITYLGANFEVAGLRFLTAHFLKLNVMMTAGGGAGVTGVVTGATIDKVSVTMAAPPIRSGWQQWLAQTPYGAQLWALLSLRSAGGLYIGGRPERQAFRKVGGNFLP